MKKLSGNGEALEVLEKHSNGESHKSEPKMKDVKEYIDKAGKFEKIFQKLFDLSTAEKPDFTAMKILLEYRFGKPAAAPEYGGSVPEVSMKELTDEQLDRISAGEPYEEVIKKHGRR
jgi:hypothetical protein